MRTLMLVGLGENGRGAYIMLHSGFSGNHLFHAAIGRHKNADGELIIAYIGITGDGFWTRFNSHDEKD